MHRTMLSWVAVILLCMTGCAMCDAPYDYCGPMQTGGCGAECDFFHRENSAFTGMSGMTISEGEPTMVDETIEEPSPLQPIPQSPRAARVGRRPHTSQIR